MGNTIPANASEIIEEVYDNEKECSSWERLYEYALRYENNNTEEENESTDDNGTLDINGTADELEVWLEVGADEVETISFYAKNDNTQVRLILTDNEENCEIYYSTVVDGVPFEISSSYVISELKDSFDFENSDNYIDAETFSLILDEAQIFIPQAVYAWSDMLLDTEIKWTDLGFICWEQLFIRNNDEVCDISVSEELPDSNEIEVYEESESEISGETEPFVLDEDLVIEEEKLTSEEDCNSEIEESEAELESAMPIPSVERISVNYDSISLKVDEKAQIKVSVFPENATNYYYSFSSSDDTYVKVSSEGLITALQYCSNPVYITVKVTDAYSHETFEKEITVSVEKSEYFYTKDEDGNTVVNGTGGNQYVTKDGIWVANFHREDPLLFEYNGKPITQYLKVYNGKDELTLNKDYTLTYKNNINAATYDMLNAPSVTITMKGQYTGKKTLYYTIKQSWLNSENYITNNNTALNYNKREQRFVPNVVINGRKLANNKDFTIEYDSNTNNNFLKGIEGDKCEVKFRIYGKGNYTGYVDGKYYIVDKKYNLSKANVSCASSYLWNGESVPAEEIAEAVNLRVKLPGTNEYVNTWTDDNISLSWSSTDSKITLYIKALNDKKYRGSIIKTINIKRPPVTKINLADVFKCYEDDFENEITFHKNVNENIQDPEIFDQIIRTELYKGTDYTVKCTGYNKVGTATLTYTGIGKYKGTYKLTYQIVNDTPQFTFNSPVNVPYVQGETKPIEWIDSLPYHERLVENVDYTIKYSNNKKVGTASYKITGKGNYSKLVPIEGTFNILCQDINKCTVTVPDKAYTGKPGSFKSTPVVTAPNGKRLVAGKDYDKNIEYIYDDWDDSNSSNYNNPAAGSLVNVKITGIGNYTGTVEGCYRVYDPKEKNIGKLFIAIDNKTYTGRPIELDIKNDVHIYKTAADMKNKTNELSNPDKMLRIISYKNNTNSGNATVTFGYNTKDSNGYGGTKNVTFKIVKKDYGCLSVSKVSLDQSSIKLTNFNTKTITASLTPSFSDVYNNNIVWKTSNPNVVKLGTVTGAYNQVCPIVAVKNGTAVITCTSQDGNKVGKCTVNVSLTYANGIKLDKQNLKLDKNATSKINYEFVPADSIPPSGVPAVYSSSDTSIATVDPSGNVKAVGDGFAKITCTVGSFKASCFVEAGTLSCVYPTSYGAFPDDNLDDTEGINKAIKAAMNKTIGNRIVLIPAGTYNISIAPNGECGIDLNNANNLDIYMEEGTILKNVSDKSNNMRGVIILDRAQNVNIEGGRIECIGGSSVDENYFGIFVVRSSGVKLKDITVNNSKGDGIYLGKDNKNNMNNNINITDCTVNGCIRNNIALVNAQNVTIEGCKLNNAKSYRLPNVSYAVGGLGIDIEPNVGNNQLVTDVNIKNCTFSGNRSDFGVHCHIHKAGCTNSTNITLDKCSFDKMVYIQCGSNIKFTNTVKRPKTYYDERNNSSTFPN